VVMGFQSQRRQSGDGVSVTETTKRGWGFSHIGKKAVMGLSFIGVIGLSSRKILK